MARWQSTMGVPSRAGLREAVKIREIWVRNFKSLRDVRVEFRGFNLLIGPNRSGKTNFLEALKLLRAVYFPKPGEEVNPFLPWWGYDRVVWRRDEKLPITIGLGLDVMGYRVDFETTFTGMGGAFRLLREAVDVEGVVRLEKNGEVLTIRHDPGFLAWAWPEVEEGKPDWLEGWTKRRLLGYEVHVDRRPGFLQLYGHGMAASALENVSVTWLLEGRALILSPSVHDPEFYHASLVGLVHDALVWSVAGSLTLRPIDARGVREQVLRPSKDLRLSEDALNLHNVLFNLWIQNGGRLPDRIEAALKDIFGPDVRVAFELTADGRLFMRVFEGDLPLDPPMISDGFYKVLAILTAVETGPSILAIDELENSLHLEAIERVLDDLRDAGCVVVATTHSPLIIDQVDPADVIFVDRDEEGATIMWRVEDPEALKRKLAEKGITLSEGWLYGRIQ